MNHPPLPPPRPARRHALRQLAATTTLAALFAAGLLRPTRVLAADWAEEAFRASDAERVLALLQAGGPPSAALRIDAPEVAENGAAVPISVASTAPGTRRLSLLIDRNPNPLALQLDFAAGVRPAFQVRLRMAESSRVQVVADTAQGVLRAERRIGVTLGGCGN